MQMIRHGQDSSGFGLGASESSCPSRVRGNSRPARSRFILGVVLLGALIFHVGLSAHASTASEQAVRICPHGEDRPEQTAILVMSTAAGEIVIELFEDAAPQAVRELVELVRASAFDGIEFDHCLPSQELRTSFTPALEDVELPIQISAEALGLDQATIEDTAEAMAVLQNELLAANQVAKKTGKTNKTLQGWMNQWYASYSAAFLVGVSRLEINRALGYVYEPGLASRSVETGAVALVPTTPRECSARFSIALTEMSGRNGRWMVVGRVVAGLDVAETISKGPLTPDKALKYRPLQPVEIETIEVRCRTQHEGG